MRKRTLATFPVALAAADTLARSNSESTLTSAPFSTARRSSHGSLPLPLKTARSGSKPAAIATLSSLPETSTHPEPSFCKCFRMLKLLLALTA